MIRRAKGIEIMIFLKKIDLNTFGSNMFLPLKITNFENVASTKH
jgi:hypothetical protein